MASRTFSRTQTTAIAGCLTYLERLAAKNDRQLADLGRLLAECRSALVRGKFEIADA